MIHVSDDLELYALDALAPAERQRIEAHLDACPACRTELDAIAGVVDALPDAAPDREPPARLRDHVLASARAELEATRAPSGAARARLRPRVLAIGALAAAAAILAAVDMGALNQLRATTQERNSLDRTVADVSFAEQSWYMSGKGAYAGSGGTLYITGKTGKAFVLFHDLKGLDPNALYTVWLVSDDQRWMRAANFTPDGQRYQRVDIDVQVAQYRRCAVTVESAATGRPSGLVVMDSPIGPPPSP